MMDHWQKWSAYFQGGMARGNRQGWNCQGNYVMNKLSANCCHMPKTIYNTSVTIVLAPMTIAVYKTFLQAVETQNCSLLLKLNFVKNPNPSQNPNPFPLSNKRKTTGLLWLTAGLSHWVPGIYSANSVGHPLLPRLMHPSQNRRPCSQQPVLVQATNGDNQF
jgi:hypothetical protein